MNAVVVEGQGEKVKATEPLVVTILERDNPNFLAYNQGYITETRPLKNVARENWGTKKLVVAGIASV